MEVIGRKAKLFLIVLSLIGLKFILTNCTRDTAQKPEKVLDETYCNTLDLSFKDDVSPLIVKSCSSSSCHGSKTKAGDYVLETYEEIKEAAESGILSCVINHESGCEPMPEGGKKFTEDKLEIVDCWIILGMPDN